MLYSHFLWSISHPNKYGYPQYDLSKEVHHPHPPGLTEKQILIERIIHKVYQQYSIPLKTIDDRTRAQFATKLWRMGKIISGLGGPKKEQKLQSWKDGKFSNWILSIDIKQLHSQLQQDHEQLQSELKAYKKMSQNVLDKNLHVSYKNGRNAADNTN